MLKINPQFRCGQLNFFKLLKGVRQVLSQPPVFHNCVSQLASGLKVRRELIHPEFAKHLEYAILLKDRNAQEVR